MHPSELHGVHTQPLWNCLNHGLKGASLNSFLASIGGRRLEFALNLDEPHHRTELFKSRFRLKGLPLQRHPFLSPSLSLSFELKIRDMISPLLHVVAIFLSSGPHVLKEAKSLTTDDQGCSASIVIAYFSATLEYRSPLFSSVPPPPVFGVQAPVAASQRMVG